MRIGELSRLTGVSVRSLRYYEEQGLLRPLRRPSGYREYREKDAATVRGIRIMLAAGLSTATIADLLPCMDRWWRHADTLLRRNAPRPAA